MLYLINALGGLGRSVTDSARHALTGADGVARWRKLALYGAMFALPGGSILVLLLALAERRRALRASASAGRASSVVAQPCAGGQPACRAASAEPRFSLRRPAPCASRGNDA
ncbi:MAG TPA: hypothetical protein VL689_17060 [Paraburkholderia sp.]|jgi:hypothetical protein|nr:hypothetical protein [Paraburkholderia sp.]